MLTADPLTNLSARGQTTHRDTREAVVRALLGSGDTHTRQEVAKAAWKSGSDYLSRLRQQARQAALATADGHRRDVFDLTRSAAHVTGDTLARETASKAARDQAARVTDETEALRIISEALLHAHRRGNEFAIVRAGAVAERAHDEGWRDAVTAWATSSVGAARGGLTRLAALQHAEAVAAGDVTLAGLADLTPLPEMVKRLGLPWVEIA